MIKTFVCQEWVVSFAVFAHVRFQLHERVCMFDVVGLAIIISGPMEGEEFFTQRRLQHVHGFEPSGLPRSVGATEDRERTDFKLCSVQVRADAT